MLQINSEPAHKMFIQLMERFDKIEKLLERQNKMKECLDGDTLLDNYDLSKLLGVTHRVKIRGIIYLRAWWNWQTRMI